MTEPVWPDNVFILAPEIVFQIFIFLSSEPDANEPDGRIANEVTELVCPLKVLYTAPEAVFQSLMVLSSLALANEPKTKK